jgi:pimeloyl-ACP methyl ester carboxylesterase
MSEAGTVTREPPWPTGQRKLALDLPGGPLEVFTHRRVDPDPGPLLVVFHGVLRNAETYRDHTVALADRLGSPLAAPLFDLARFPTARYQQGGLLRDGEPQPRTEWSFSLIPALLTELRRRLGDPQRPVLLLGHSGGGQFLVRLAAMQPLAVQRIVAANPGTLLLPDLTNPWPFGWGGLPGEIAHEQAVRDYLARPLTLYLGTGDTVRDENLDVSSAADRQGMNRYERGRRAYFRGLDLARKWNVPFGWRLIEAEGIPHDHEQMFNHPACLAALAASERESAAPRQQR